MNTPTHLSLAVALLGRKSHPKNTKWIVWGALLPDIPMYLLLAFDLLRRVPMREIWSERYFQDYWQIPLDIVNSVWLYLALALIGYFWKKNGLIFLSAAALLHIAFDLPLHREDAHAHFWPLTDWKFVSPVSYWDRAHYGNIVQVFEMVLLVITGLIGVRVFAHLWSKVLFLIVTLFMPLAYLGFFLFRYFGA